MKLSKLTVAAAGLLAGVAIAHHVPVPLSYFQGSEILTEIVLFAKPGNVGVPPYHVTTVEVDHDATFAIPAGSSFSVHDGSSSESVVFEAADFADPAAATVHEVLDAINAKSTQLHGFDDNGYLFLRGQHGGSGASVQLADGIGSPLALLGFAPALVAGADDVPLELSIPLPEPGAPVPPSLAGHAYVLLASATPGTSSVLGEDLPFAQDAVTAAFLRATLRGALPGFLGALDANEDAQAVLDTALLAPLAGGSLPDEIYFAYVVLSSDLGAVDFVSNPFTVDIEQ